MKLYGLHFRFTFRCRLVDFAPRHYGDYYSESTNDRSRVIQGEDITFRYNFHLFAIISRYGRVCRQWTHVFRLKLGQDVATEWKFVNGDWVDSKQKIPGRFGWKFVKGAWADFRQ
jgi:hypothetical protein